ncbi:uncharacterized protein LOC123307229 [Coccinella septempunctata]|uniref:uncharacterized protein LOC123307229 n=1 Tax=Coccinella septempunctata TaxID=41139 RepID=UPI001D0656E5|nr:uncharacterized protein LOC123307229 [Coccinella septempunctata]
MDVVFESGNIAQGSGCFLIMDNDSGYVSNNLDQESNSDSVPDTLNNSSVEILKSLLPKSVYISEDALLERPDPDQTITATTSEEGIQEFSVWNSDNLSNVVLNCANAAAECAALPKFNSFQSDSGSSINSVVVPIAPPIYYDLNNKLNSSPPLLNDDENISSNPSDGPFFGYENVPMEGTNLAFRNCFDICTNGYSSTENQINSLFLGFLSNTQKHTGKSPSVKEAISPREGPNISETETDPTVNEILVQKSDTPEETHGPFVEKSSDPVADDSLINIEDLPVFIEEYPISSGKPEDATILSTSVLLKNETMNNVTPLKLENIEVEEISNVRNDGSCSSACVLDLNNETNNAVSVQTEQLQDKTKISNETETGSNVLTNVTNISIRDIEEAGPSKISIPQRRNSTKNKENFAETFKTPSKCRKRKFSEVGSPDLFSDDESSKAKPSASPKIIEERFVHKFDHRLIKRVQKTLSGVPPPPDLTITRLTVDDILEKLEANKSYFWTTENLTQATIEKSEGEKASLNGSHNSSLGCTSSILIEGQHEEAVNKEFPDILYSRHHGLHYNRSKLSEEIEHLCDKYAKRYIGAETQSTCNAVETEYMSPGRRKSARPKWAVKSPGRRLSHLAKRRITFSSASLQASSSSSAASRARQILIDYKKLELLNRKKSPKKSPIKTPMKSPMASPSNGRTPSSSAKKKLRMRFRLLSGDFKEMTSEPSSSASSSKRALFQSPDKETKFKHMLTGASTAVNSSFERDLANRGAKRSLFSSPNKISCRASLFPSPNKKSPFKNQHTFEKKRKRDDDDENIANQPKFFRSQSYAEREVKPESSLTRTKSESVLVNSQTMTDLSAANKKKLQWAVYDSLKDQNITTAHPQFKDFACVLARVTRRCIVSSNIRLEGSGTSEKILRVARRHVYAVVKGKSVEEIMSEVHKTRVKNIKPQGYIAPQDYNPFPRESSYSRESALRDRDSNSGDSVTKSSSSQMTTNKPESRIDRIRKVINFEDNR